MKAVKNVHCSLVPRCLICETRSPEPHHHRMHQGPLPDRGMINQYCFNALFRVFGVFRFCVLLSAGLVPVVGRARLAVRLAVFVGVNGCRCIITALSLPKQLPASIRAPDAIAAASGMLQLCTTVMVVVLPIAQWSIMNTKFPGARLFASDLRRRMRISPEHTYEDVFREHSNMLFDALALACMMIVSAMSVVLDVNSGDALFTAVRQAMFVLPYWSLPMLLCTVSALCHRSSQSWFDVLLEQEPQILQLDPANSTRHLSNGREDSAALTGHAFVSPLTAAITEQSWTGETISTQELPARAGRSSSELADQRMRRTSAEGERWVESWRNSYLTVERACAEASGRCSLLLCAAVIQIVVLLASISGLLYQLLVIFPPSAEGAAGPSLTHYLWFTGGAYLAVCTTFFYLAYETTRIHTACLERNMELDLRLVGVPLVFVQSIQTLIRGRPFAFIVFGGRLTRATLQRAVIGMLAGVLPSVVKGVAGLK